MRMLKMLAGQRSGRNHIIVEACVNYSYVDARGMGVRTKVVPALKALGIEAQFEATEDYLKSTVTKIPAGIGGGASVGKESGKRSSGVGKEGESGLALAKSLSRGVGKTSEKVLETIRLRNDITIAELATMIGETERSIERNLRTLRERGYVRRVGGRKQGAWEVILP